MRKKHPEGQVELVLRRTVEPHATAVTIDATGNPCYDDNDDVSGICIARGKRVSVVFTLLKRHSSKFDITHDSDGIDPKITVGRKVYDLIEKLCCTSVRLTESRHSKFVEAAGGTLEDFEAALAPYLLADALQQTE